jgi:hypothetical protein
VATGTDGAPYSAQPACVRDIASALAAKRLDIFFRCGMHDSNNVTFTRQCRDQIGRSALAGVGA